MAAFSGAKGDSPAAIRSALTNTGQAASLGRNSRAKVDLPAPFGPAITMTRFASLTAPTCGGQLGLADAPLAGHAFVDQGLAVGGQGVDLLADHA
jgi:hypothetical protein